MKSKDHMTRRAIVYSMVIALGSGIIGPAKATSEMLVAFVNFFPNGFQLALTGHGMAGLWQLEDDPTVPGVRVLGQTLQDPTENRYPLAILNKLSLEDLWASVQIKCIGGSASRVGGIAFRIIGPDNFYAVSIDTLTGMVALHRVIDGSWHQIRSADVVLDTDNWNTLSVGAKSSQFTVLVNGKYVFSVTDPAPVAKGRFGVWTKADSLARFHDLRFSSGGP